MTRAGFVLVLGAFAVLSVVLPAKVAVAQERPLTIPQVEGARQGGIVGRALACGLDGARAETVLRVGRERMIAAVGRAFAEDRYLPELDRAIGFESSLPRPSDAACRRALEAFEGLEAVR